METYSGVRFDLSNPNPDDVRLDDIALHLAGQSRFLGAYRPLWSVAEHCILVSQFAPTGWEKHGLLHDAAEAYIGDIITPVKELLGDQIAAIEDRVAEAVFAHFGLLPNDWAYTKVMVKLTDDRATATEARRFRPHGTANWEPVWGKIESLPVELEPLGPDEAYRAFMARAEELGITE
jgi:hypothetical protein